MYKLRPFQVWVSKPIQKMKVKYDSHLDILRIVFSEKPIAESDEDKEGVILDYDKDGNVVGIEILFASKKMANPKIVEYEMA